MVVHAMADDALEPNYSMGDDIPIAPLGKTPRRLYNHLRQRFAQVTNPAIDSLREKPVMSLRVLLGARGATLSPEGDAARELAKRVHPAMAAHERPFTHPLLELDSPVLGAGELARVLESAVVLGVTFGPEESLRGAIERLCTEAAAAAEGALVLSDRRAGRGRLPV